MPDESFIRLPAPILLGSVAGCIAMLVARSASLLPIWIDLHISNVAFTLLGMLILGRGRLRRGFTRGWLRVYGAGFAVVNLLVETVDIGDLRWGVMEFSDVNTADPLDALFGLVGIAASVLLLPRFAQPLSTPEADRLCSRTRKARGARTLLDGNWTPPEPPEPDNR